MLLPSMLCFSYPRCSSISASSICSIVPAKSLFSFDWMSPVLWQSCISRLTNSISFSVRMFFDCLIFITSIFVLYGDYYHLHGLIFSLVYSTLPSPLSPFFIYGGIINPTSELMFRGCPKLKMFFMAYMRGPFDLVQATVFFLWFGAQPMLEKFDRIKVKWANGALKKQIKNLSYLFFSYITILGEVLLQ